MVVLEFCVGCRVLNNYIQFLSLECKLGLIEDPFIITIIYGKCNKVERRELWHALESNVPNGTWLVRGDFNIVGSAKKMLGGNPIDFGIASEFNDFISKSGLTDFSCLGSAYT